MDEAGWRRALEAEANARIAEGGAGRVALAFYDTATGRELLIQADERFHAASTYKVCVLMELFRQAHRGAFALDERLAIRNEFKSIVDGSPFTLAATSDSDTEIYEHIGQEMTLRELARRMIVRSSNLATNLLVEKVGAESATRFMRELGAKNVQVLRGVEDSKAFALGMNNTVTARGLMQIFVRLARGEVVSPAASREMTDILLAQEFNSGIPAGLPGGVRVAHKTGSITGVYHDAGIVYLSGRAPYVLVVLTDGLKQEAAGPKLVAALSRLCYERLPSR